MAELKTQKNDGDVMAFIDSVENEKRREFARHLLEVFKDETGFEPQLWGPSIIGYGSYTYKYASGHSGEWMLTGFSPRKQSMTLYIMPGFDHYGELLEKLGKHKTGKSCLYINKESDVDMDIVRQLIRESVEFLKNYKTE